MRQQARALGILKREAGARVSTYHPRCPEIARGSRLECRACRYTGNDGFIAANAQKLMNNDEFLWWFDMFLSSACKCCSHNAPSEHGPHGTW